MTLSLPETNVLAMPTIDESRNALLDAIGPAPEMTLIRPFGNYGDELIWAGTRELLRGHVYREIGIDQIASAGGELAVLSGGGAWSRRYNEMMPEALAIAELRFERVIVLPSTFEVSEDRVRAALERSDAIVFARERESFEQIRGICRARLAHDCAFFADYSAYAAPGDGELNAFRIDDERTLDRDVPDGNVDISDAAESLEAWLRTIERHAVVNTDRAHVMIAAALMGKRVNYAPSSYFKVDAIARFALGDFDVHPLEETSAASGDDAATAHSARLGVAHDELPVRATVAVLSRDHGAEAVEAIESVLGEPADAGVLVLDRNSRPLTRAALSRVLERDPQIEIKFANRDSGEGASVRLATELAESEYVMFLGDRMRLAPGALRTLIDVLDSDPAASAVAAALVDESGAVQHCGGWTQVGARTFEIEPVREGDSTVTGWVPTQGTLFRRSVLEHIPFADGLEPTCQNADWCLRVERLAPGSLRRCPDAQVIAPVDHVAPHGTSLVERGRAVRSLPSHAKFLETHGRLLANPLMELVPELREPDDSLCIEAGTLLLAIVEARGTIWTLMEWMNGGLDLLLTARPTDAEPELPEEVRERMDWLEARNERLIAIENGGWWKLRGRLRGIVGK